MHYKKCKVKLQEIATDDLNFMEEDLEEDPIKEGDFVEYLVSSLDNVNHNIQSYKCQKCEALFVSSKFLMQHKRARRYLKMLRKYENKLKTDTSLFYSTS